jgi:hypothetical protein
MTDSIKTDQRRKHKGNIIALVFEWLGILNKGSTTSAPTPPAGEAAKTAGVNTNSLNVTRVGGLGTFVGSIGVSALALFSVDDKDPPIVIMAAYISVGVIVAAAVVTVGLIITADIRSRVALTATTPAAVAVAGTTTSPDSSLVADWRQVVATLRSVVECLQRPEQDMTDAWLDASASAGKVAGREPAAGQQSLHARLQAGHALFMDKLRKLTDATGDSERTAVLAGLRELVLSMERSLQDWSE